MTVCVVGLGKIGLPLAVQFASEGQNVRGTDLNHDTVAAVNRGEEPFPGETDLAVKLRSVVEAGRLEASVSTRDAVSRSKVVVIVVPLVVDRDGNPDFRSLDEATAEVSKGLQPDTLVIYETTLPVGTTRRRFQPMLEAGSGLAAGRGFLLAFSPERIFSGRVFSDLRRYPKLIGGVDAASSRSAAAFYKSVLRFDDRPDLKRPNGVWDLGSAEAAEFAKLAETTYRDVNIALANEFARICEVIGADATSILDACNSQPFSHIHQPGIAVGGHCIPIYPQLLLWGYPEAELVRVARNTNASVPSRIIDKLDAALEGVRGLEVVVLGVSYRGAVKESAFSGAFAVAKELQDRGARVRVHDPLYSWGEILNLGLQPYELGTHVDVAILQADHPEYHSWSSADLPGVRVLLDGRGSLSGERWPGVQLLRVGDGTSPWTKQGHTGLVARSEDPLE